MAQGTMITRTGKTIESSPWIIPGALLGTYVLTRLPFSLLTGLALGFAAGWSLRGEQDESGGGGRGRSPERRREARREDEKVDEMSEESFPASDPPAYTAARTGKPRKS